ncbi:Disease resistance protein [Melia azedarach]|uniref:Disease resistance protein n=1 Tax=Melia azedarach TaxID=155640 RepID=A0ACC1Y4E7_MELAZ|nr:Disease resistance protein [Melia azedarach]
MKSGTVWEKKSELLACMAWGESEKTTLLNQINNKFFEAPNDFDIVLWVVASKDLQIERIQETIGRKIGLFDELWKNKSLEEKAEDIFKILRKKKFVVLLDDLWNRIDLSKVGVPTPSINSLSKILFTTRSIRVCGLMEVHKKFKVECLAHEEAWKLFQMKVGTETLESHSDIPDLAQIIAKECGGLPLALITIGRAMAFKKTPQEWKDAIQVLRRSASEFPGMDEVYPLLKFSYDSLPSEKIKSCFLYCSLFPEDFNISKIDLIDCWIGEGFFDEYERGYTIIGDLLRACLLEEVNDNNVKLHDVIRDMSLWIASEVEREKEIFFVQVGARLTDAPEVGKWEGADHGWFLPIYAFSQSLKFVW